VADRTCTIDGCERIPRARGWCTRHYGRWRKYGDPLGGGPYHDFGDVTERFWSKVQKADGCWNWLGNLDKNGYGTFGRHSAAHRYAYELAHGKLPRNILVDHTCHNPRCVRLDHLRPATQKQNQENHSGARVDSKSGVRGVCWDKRRRKWLVQVGHNGRNLYVGHYGSLADAEAAAIAKRNELFTHNDRDRITA